MKNLDYFLSNIFNESDTIEEEDLWQLDRIFPEVDGKKFSDIFVSEDENGRWVRWNGKTKRVVNKCSNELNFF
jgi:hypothetical protein